jgi:hypothetical protein
MFEDLGRMYDEGFDTKEELVLGIALMLLGAICRGIGGSCARRGERGNTRQIAWSPFVSKPEYTYARR